MPGKERVLTGAIKGKFDMKDLPADMELAWAATIHKGQGKTFDRIILDLKPGTFAAGQADDERIFRVDTILNLEPAS